MYNKLQSSAQDGGLEGKLRLVLNASLFRDMQEFRAREIYFTLIMVGV